MMQVVLLIMKDYRHATALIMIIFHIEIKKRHTIGVSLLEAMVE